ncbi:cell division protein FtsQ/DivIB [Bifidobacterium leontopitheci]
MTARASGRAVTSQSAVSRTATSKSATSRSATSRSATSRSVKSPARSVVSRKASSRTHPERSTHGRAVDAHGGRTGRDVQSQAQGFVDARALRSDDVLGRTLSENVGPLGVATRPKVLDFDARLKERRKAGSKVVALRLLIVALVCAAIGGLVWLLLFSTVFRLERADISISGVNEWVSRSEVMDIASQQSGKSLFLVSTDDIDTKLKNIPGVTQAEAVKHYPRSLTVTVKAQQPAAMLKEPDGTLVAVDRKARVLNAVGKASTKGIPVIEVSSVSKGLNSRAVKEALNILGGLPDTMRNAITKVSAKTQDSITTELDSGAIVVVWGDSSQLELKSAIVDKLTNDKSALGGKHQIDVSAPSRPIIK